MEQFIHIVSFSILPFCETFIWAFIWYSFDTHSLNIDLENVQWARRKAQVESMTFAKDAQLYFAKSLKKWHKKSSTLIELNKWPWPPLLVLKGLVKLFWLWSNILNCELYRNSNKEEYYVVRSNTIEPSCSKANNIE